MDVKNSLVPALDRALNILEYLASRQEAATLKQIAGDLDIPSASAFRLLKNLANRGYVKETSSGQTAYCLGYKLLQLSHAWLPESFPPRDGKTLPAAPGRPPRPDCSAGFSAEPPGHLRRSGFFQRPFKYRSASLHPSGRKYQRFRKDPALLSFCQRTGSHPEPAAAHRLNAPDDHR